MTVIEGKTTMERWFRCILPPVACEVNYGDIRKSRGNCFDYSRYSRNSKFDKGITMYVPPNVF